AQNGHPGQSTDPNKQAIQQMNEAIVQDAGGQNVHAFDPDASPAEKKAQAEASIPKEILPPAKAEKPVGAVAEVQSKPAVPPIEAAEKQVARKSTTQKEKEEKGTLKAAEKPKAKPPQTFPTAAKGKIPAFYEVGWNSFSGLDLPGAAPKVAGDPDAGLIEMPNLSIKKENEIMTSWIDHAYFGELRRNAGVLLIATVWTWWLTRIGGWVWALFVVGAFVITYYHNHMRRLRRNAYDDMVLETIKTRLDNNAETADWINTFLARFWRIYEPVLSAQVISQVDGVLADNCPPFLDSLRLTTFTLGTKPPTIDEVRSYPRTKADEVQFEMRVSFTPNDTADMTRREIEAKRNPKVALTVRVGKGFVGAGAPILVEDMSFKGHVRVKLQLMTGMPFVKQLAFCFLETPEIGYVLKPVGGEHFGVDIMSLIPGLAPFIRSQINNNLGPMMYYPNEFKLDIDSLVNGPASSSTAIGVLAVTVHSGQGIKNVELIGKSDPYVRFLLEGKPELGRTSVQQDTTDPKWEETHFLLLNDLEEVLKLAIYDKDENTKDKSMGTAEFDLKSIKDAEDGTVAGQTLTVMRTGKPVGTLSVDFKWCPMLKESKKEDGTTVPPPESNTGILRFTLQGCSELDSTKGEGDRLNAYARVLVNGAEKIKSKAIKRTNNPNWNKNFEMLIVDRTQTNIYVEIKHERDFAEDPVIGTYTTSLIKLLSNLEKKITEFDLKDARGGTLRLTAVWKPVNLEGLEELLGHGAYIPPIGVLRFRAFEARDVKNVEAMSGGKSDPFIRALCNGQERDRTEVIDNTLNPVWNEWLYVPVHTMTERIYLECMDWQNNGSHRSLGMVHIDLEGLVKEIKKGEGKNQIKWHEATGKTIDTRAPLATVNNKPVKGDLHYFVSFHPTLKFADEAGSKNDDNENGKDDRATEEKPKAPKQIDRSVDLHGEKVKLNSLKEVDILAYQSGVLSVTVHNARFTSSVHACAEICVDSNDAQYRSPAVRGQTVTVEDTGDAFIRELDFSRIVISFRKAGDRTNREPPYCQFSGQVKDLLRQQEEVKARRRAQKAAKPAVENEDDNDDHEDEDRGTEFHFDGPNPGTVTLSFKYTPVIQYQMERSESLDNQGQLNVTLLKANGLIAADRGGTSDPYVVAKLGEAKLFKSQTYKKTLDPVFKNETFQVGIQSRETARLTLEIYDFDQVGTADELGVTEVPLAGDAVEAFMARDRQLPVMLKGQQAGTITVRLNWQPQLLARKKTGTVFTGATRMLTGAPGAVFGAGGKVVGGGAKVVGGGVGAVGHGLKQGGSALASGFGFGKKKLSQDMTHADGMVNSTSNESIQPQQNGNLSQLAPAQAAQGVNTQGGNMVGAPGTVSFTILEASGLRAVDRGGSSDPYVRVKVGNKEIFKSKIKKKTLEPHWDETFTYHVDPSPITFDIILKDHNAIGKDEGLGEFVFPLWDIMKHQPGQPSHFEEWLALQPQGSGKLRVRVEFTPNA
ncbi:hypothetical protein BZG36_02423, partial [Bifiguratus adelaidae]